MCVGAIKTIGLKLMHLPTLPDFSIGGVAAHCMNRKTSRRLQGFFHMSMKCKTRRPNSIIEANLPLGDSFARNVGLQCKSESGRWQTA